MDDRGDFLMGFTYFKNEFRKIGHYNGKGQEDKRQDVGGYHYVLF